VRGTAGHDLRDGGEGVPLTPTDVAHKQFAIKMRGYAVDEVDVFLEEVEGELARLLRENDDLRLLVSDLRRQLG
jgi:DivIVA domain-containing protein